MEFFSSRKVIHRIEEIKTLLVSTHEHYLRNRKPSQLQAICRLCFELGYETARLSILQSREINERSEKTE